MVPSSSAPTRRDLLATAAAAGAVGCIMRALPSAAQTVAAAGDDTIRPFHVNFPDDALVDLRQRITATRWPEKETVTDASQGVQLATVQKLANYWQTDYDWRKVEAQAERFAAIHDRDRRARHSFHPRSFEA